MTEQELPKERINQMALFDQLTGIANRTLLKDRMNQASAAMARNGSHGALLHIDLDYFNSLNENHVYEKGDILLQQVAQRLTECARQVDTVARLSRNEFVVMLVGLSSVLSEAAKHIEQVGERIHAAISRGFQVMDETHFFTPNIGVTMLSEYLESNDALKSQPGFSKRKAIGVGLNNAITVNHDRGQALSNGADQAQALRDAIENKQLQLHFHPQIADNRLIGVEAQVRWLHPERGTIHFSEFRALAEETRLILPLGRWALESVCERLSSWAKRPDMAHVTVTMNVTARDICQPRFVESVLSALRRAGANPRRLKLKLNEKLMMSNVDVVVAKLFRLQAKGVAFSVCNSMPGDTAMPCLRRMPLKDFKGDQAKFNHVI